METLTVHQQVEMERLLTKAGLEHKDVTTAIRRLSRIAHVKKTSLVKALEIYVSSKHGKIKTSDLWHKVCIAGKLIPRRELYKLG